MDAALSRIPNKRPANSRISSGASTEDDQDSDMSLQTRIPKKPRQQMESDSKVFANYIKTKTGSKEKELEMKERIKTKELESQERIRMQELELQERKLRLEEA
ncbi:hypothetical protein HK096_002060, partial [Nowakowskiella sp. JEL0078]